MSIIGSLVRPMAAVVALTVGIVPAALAQGHKGRDRGALVEEGKKGEHQFPMTAAEFTALVEKRITNAREHLEKAMNKRGVPEAVQTQVKKDFAAGAVLIRGAVSKAGADGTVTKDEAKDVRKLSKDLKHQAMEKYGLGHGKKGKGKGKNKDKADA